jgi:hypothetical protein
MFSIKAGFTSIQIWLQTLSIMLAHFSRSWYINPCSYPKDSQNWGGGGGEPLNCSISTYNIKRSSFCVPEDTYRDISISSGQRAACEQTLGVDLAGCEGKLTAWNAKAWLCLLAQDIHTSAYTFQLLQLFVLLLLRLQAFCHCFLRTSSHRVRCAGKVIFSVSWSRCFLTNWNSIPLQTFKSRHNFFIWLYLVYAVMH